MPPASTLSLAALRAELDRTDDALLATLVRRAALSTSIGALAAKGDVKIRPGREAVILRRLLAQPLGDLRAQTVVRIWRELLAGSTALQGPFSVGVCATDGASDLLALAREQFGALTPLAACPTAELAIEAVRTGAATVAVLPMPDEQEDGSAWWTALLGQRAPRLHVVGRLPFWRPRPAGAPNGPALVLAAAPPDPSGEDVSLIGVGAPPTRAALAAALAAADLPLRRLILRDGVALAEIEGFVDDDDARLSRLTAAERPVVLGAYAMPLSGA